MPLGPLELVVAILAAYRATRLLTKDSIFQSARDRIELWSANEEVRADFGLKHRRRHRLAAKADELVTCPFCLGWWLSIVTYVVFVLALRRWSHHALLTHAVEAWAVMGGQALLNAVDAVFAAYTRKVELEEEAAAGE